MAAASRSGGVAEEVANLSVEQLQAVKEQIDAELSVLQDSVSSIRTAANRFEMAAHALNNLSTQKAGLPRKNPFMRLSFAVFRLNGSKNFLLIDFNYSMPSAVADPEQLIRKLFGEVIWSSNQGLENAIESDTHCRGWCISGESSGFTLDDWSSQTAQSLPSNYSMLSVAVWISD